MAASGVEAVTVTDLPLLRQIDLPPVETTDSFALQAIKGLRCQDDAPFSSPHQFIHPKSALHLPALHFGRGMTIQSSQYSHIEEEKEQSASLLPEQYTNSELIFSSCSEDAEGEPDESYHTESSFWMTHPGDTSASTAATLDNDDPQIPLLGRDGTWKAADPRTIATRDDVRSEGANQGSALQRPLPLSQLGKISKPSLLYNPPNTTTRQKRAPSFSSSDSEDLPLARSIAKKQKKRKPNRSPEKKATGKAVRKAKSASKEQRHSPKSRKKASSSKAHSSNNRRLEPLASSETGSSTSSRKPSSPASSNGRYKLRKKESVPKLRLAALLTPPRNLAPQPSDEDVEGLAGWVDQVDQDRAATPEASTSKLEDSYEADIADEGDELDNSLSSPSSARVRSRGQRTFPADWEIHPDFPLLYQRYFVPSSVSPEVLEMLLRGLNHTNVDDEFHEVVDRAQTVQGTFNKPRSILDLYTPRFVKGVGSQKVGMCPVCYEDGKVKFLKTKFSAYNYHLQNFHGISALTGLPFTPPSKFRGKARPNAKPKERKEIIQGLCHSCNKYIDIQGPKETEVKVAEIYWWKHAQACHRSRNVPDGVGGYFVENKWFERVCGVLELLGGFQGELRKLLNGNK